MMNINQLPLNIQKKLGYVSTEKRTVAVAKRNKYKNQIVEFNGWKFHSKLECNFYVQLLALQKCGKVEFFLRQVPFHLAPGSKYIVDFMVKYKDDQNTHFIDTKGFLTPEAKTKIKMTEHLYNVKIEIVRRGEFDKWK